MIARLSMQWTPHTEASSAGHEAYVQRGRAARLREPRFTRLGTMAMAVFTVSENAENSEFGLQGSRKPHAYGGKRGWRGEGDFRRK